MIFVCKYKRKQGLRIDDKICSLISPGTGIDTKTLHTGAALEHAGAVGKEDQPMGRLGRARAAAQLLVCWRHRVSRLLRQGRAETALVVPKLPRTRGSVSRFELDVEAPHQQPCRSFAGRCCWEMETASAEPRAGSGGCRYCPVFPEIGERLGPFDLAAIPIGAYEPRWVLKTQHCNPQEAVKIHRVRSLHLAPVFCSSDALKMCLSKVDAAALQPPGGRQDPQGVSHEASC